MAARRDAGLDHLTLLDVQPPELVGLAAAAGFDVVGLRVAPVTSAEPVWPMSPGSAMIRETARRCAATGIAVLDVEAILLSPAPDLAVCEAVLETAAVLGARHVITICEDPDLGRFADHFAELVRLARAYRVRPVIEFMVFRYVRTLADAVAIVKRSGGGGLLLDTLHMQRCGVSSADLTEVDLGLLSYVQVCDAPARPPHGVDEAAEARSGRLLPGEGELPLAQMLGALPAGLAVSVEAPNLAARRTCPAAEFAVRARRALASVLEEVPS
jgi:sugar phosphate isomerase/epimerase